MEKTNIECTKHVWQFRDCNNDGVVFFECKTCGEIAEGKNLKVERPDCNHMHKQRDPADDNCLLCGSRVFAIEDDPTFQAGNEKGFDDGLKEGYKQCEIDNDLATAQEVYDRTEVVPVKAVDEFRKELDEFSKKEGA